MFRQTDSSRFLTEEIMGAQHFDFALKSSQNWQFLDQNCVFLKKIHRQEENFLTG